MSDQWSPTPAAPATPAVEPGTDAHLDASSVDESVTGPPVLADVPAAVTDELAVLDQLEADLSAVEQAIESLERVSAEGLVGDDAAARIAAAVSVERFGAGSTI